MKAFISYARNTNPFEAAVRWLDEIRRTYGRDYDDECKTAVPRAFWHWALSSRRNVKCLLFVDVVQRRLSHSRGIRSDRLYEFISARVPRTAGKETVMQEPATAPASPEREGSSVFERIAARILPDFDDTAVVQATSRSKRALLQELLRAFHLGPADDAVFWTRIYKRRSREDEPFTWFIEAQSYHRLVVCGSPGAGKSSLISSYLLHLRNGRPACDEHLTRPDVFYVDVSLMRDEVRRAHAQALEYCDGIAGDPSTQEELEEILQAQIEALLEGQLVSKIQLRLVGCFRAMITEESADTSALHRTLGLRLSTTAVSREDSPDSRARCHVAAVALIAARQKRRDMSRRMMGLEPSPICSFAELQAQIERVVGEIAGRGAHDLNTLLSRFDVSACDGSLWRRVYAMCFGRAQPMVIFDNLESLDADCAVRSAVRAALKIDAGIAGTALAADRWWKTILAVRDEAEILSEAPKLGAAKTAWIKLMTEPALKAEECATWYLPLTAECRRDILADRISEALTAWAPREWNLLASAALSREVASVQVDRLGGVEFDSVVEWLAQTFEFVANTLYQRMRHAHKQSSPSMRTGDLGRRDKDNVLFDSGILNDAMGELKRWRNAGTACIVVATEGNSEASYLKHFGSGFAEHSRSSRLISRPLLMQECENCVSGTVRAGRLGEAVVAQSLLIDAHLYRSWEVDHLQPLQQVCAERPGMTQEVASHALCLRLVCLECDGHLSREQLAEHDRQVLFTTTDWNADRRAHEIQQDNNYARAASSLLFAHPTRLHLLRDTAVGQLLQQSEQAYDDYFRACCTNSISTARGNRSHLLPTLLPYLREILTMLADERLASGSADGTIKLWNAASGARAATLEGHSGRFRALAMLADGRLVSGSYDKSVRIWAYNNRRKARGAQGDLDGALEDYDKAIRLKSDDATAYYNRGIARRDKGDLNGAAMDFAEKRCLAEALQLRSE
jgi:tetratricopeptide (TPR) repeat protein